MNKQATQLDNISGKLFLTGFFLSKLKSISGMVLSPILNIVSLVAYLFGYITWYLATLFYPDHPRKRDAWYGFTEFKEQYQAAAFLGTFASILCLVNPALILPAVWIFSLSSMVWMISEYHKYRNPPSYDQNFSSARQATYLRYVATTTAISLITAFSVSLAIALPVTAGASLLIGVVVGNALTILALYYWKRSLYDEFEPDNSILTGSHRTIMEAMHSENDLHCDVAPSPTQDSSCDVAHISSIWARRFPDAANPTIDACTDNSLTV